MYFNKTVVVNARQVVLHKNLYRMTLYCCFTVIMLLLSSGSVMALDCGGEGQRACSIFVRIPSCDPYLVERSGRCIHPDCGREGERACVITERIPSCDANLVESAGKCMLQTPCGGEGQRPCKIWERTPSCNTNLIEYPLGVSCIHPACGRVEERACNVTERIPSCDAGLIEWSGKCVQSGICGGKDQRPCTIAERIPSCNADLIEWSGKCVVRNECGGEGQRPCTIPERIPSCNAYLIEQPLGVSCVHPACGRENERACTVGERLPSCDANLVEWSGKCVPHGICGKEGQRPCLLWERTPSCETNLIEQPLGVTCVHPPCGRENERACTVNERLPSCDKGLTESDGMCLLPTPCGGLGQRACTLMEQGLTNVGVCNAGLVEVGGCNGSCLGTGGMSSSGRCFDPNATISEPSTNAVVLSPKPNDPMRGFADLHVHMFSHLAFGGGVMAGTPYSATGGIADALRPDFGTNLDLVSFADTPIPVNICPPLIKNCGKNVLHGDHVRLFDDTTGLGTGDETKSNFGAPFFNGWPTWHTTTHQQVYYKWLERAWRGGLRLMVMLAVNNEILCRVSKRIKGTDCGDTMRAIDAQLMAAIEFQNWLDQQPDGGWFRIVHNPEEAEAVIRDGKLAVVLGIETDNLFNCKLRSDCTTEYVKNQIDKYYDLGVRHIFPIHNFDNGFGGTAIWRDLFNIGNRMIEGEWYDVEHCHDDISDYELPHGLPAEVLNGIVGEVVSDISVPYPLYPDGPHCNRKGLSDTGKQLVGKLMDMGMIIDIDHMSAKSIDDTATMARSRGNGYPLVASHVTLSDLHKTSTNSSRNEIMKTSKQLEIVRELGGMVGIITTDDKEVPLTIKLPESVGGKLIVDDCTNSSKSLAQSYLYATEVVKISTGFGSDFNGLAPHYGPRFGDDACHSGKIKGQRQAQLAAKRKSMEQPGSQVPDRPLVYPFSIDGFGLFDQQVTGQRKFDFNIDGFAHIGLFPDLIADLSNVGITNSELEPLFQSAAAYVDIWKRARDKATKPTDGQCNSWKEQRLDKLFSELCSVPLTQRPTCDSSVNACLDDGYVCVGAWCFPW